MLISQRAPLNPFKQTHWNSFQMSTHVALFRQSSARHTSSPLQPNRTSFKYAALIWSIPAVPLSCETLRKGNKMSFILTSDMQPLNKLFGSTTLLLPMVTSISPGRLQQSIDMSRMFERVWLLSTRTLMLVPNFNARLCQLPSTNSTGDDARGIVDRLRKLTINLLLDKTTSKPQELFFWRLNNDSVAFRVRILAEISLILRSAIFNKYLAVEFIPLKVAFAMPENKPRINLDDRYNIYFQLKPPNERHSSVFISNLKC